MSRAVVLIPARFASSRFPGKPLCTISGKSMIKRVYENCSSSGFETYVVTDNDKIENHVKEFKGKVLRVNDEVPSGTERIALAYERFLKDKKFDFVINVQGDEPLLRGKTIKDLIRFHEESSFDIATIVRERKNTDEDFSNPNVVKAVLSASNGACLYFSRQSIPYDRDEKKSFTWHHHIGVYSYKASALMKMISLPLSRLEDLEKLEQLRALENGLSIGGIATPDKLVSVDVPDDVKKVEGALSEKAL